MKLCVVAAVPFFFFGRLYNAAITTKEGVMSSEHKQITVEKDNDGIERRKINDIAEHTLYV